MSDKKKITEEQLKQLMAMQKMMAQVKGKNAKTDALKENKSISLQERIKNFSFKNLFLAILKKMDSCVKFVDQFVGFITNNKAKVNNTVISDARSPILFGTYVIIIFLGFGGLWASFAPLDSASVAIGTVVSSSKKQVITAAHNGNLYKVYVNIGDNVKAGQKIMSLDNIKERSNYENALSRYRLFLARENRLVSQLNNDSKVKYDKFLVDNIDDRVVARIIETQNDIFVAQTNSMKANIDANRQKLKQLNKQLEGYNIKRNTLIKTIDSLQERVESTKALVKKNYANKSELAEREARLASYTNDLALTDAEIAKMHEEIIAINIVILNTESDFFNKILNELGDVQVHLSDARDRYYLTKDQFDRSIITSPVDGVINNINFFTVGRTIPAGSTVAEVSPSNDSLIIDAKVDPKNIDSISEGLNAKVRFSAFKSRTTPVFRGKVISLSPDVIMENNPAMAQRPGGGAYYLAKIELDKEQFNAVVKSRNIKLHPGMTAEVQIVTGTRTLLKYLLDPVLDAMFKGLKEK